MKRLLITGARGQVGSELARQATGRFHVLAVGSDQLDITNFRAIEATLERFCPDLVINAAAYTAVDKAESEPQKATAINVNGAQNLALACAQTAARLVHISTDFVFDGAQDRPYRPDDETRPLSVYGRTKRDGERAVLEALSTRCLIIRTSWVWMAGRHNFYSTICRLLESRDEVHVVNDQFGTPTWAPDLCGAILNLSERDEAYRQRILHWTNDGATTWYEFAVAIHNALRQRHPEKQLARVLPVPSAEYPTAARRPRYSVLDCAPARQLLGPAQAWNLPICK